MIGTGSADLVMLFDARFFPYKHMNVRGGNTVTTSDCLNSPGKAPEDHLPSVTATVLRAQSAEAISLLNQVSRA